jgi:hypothetical protein
MIGRWLPWVLTVSALVTLASCSTPQRAKTTAPSTALNSNVAPSPEVRVTWSASDLANPLSFNKDLKRAWAEFERSQKYRLAQPGETQHTPFLVWWGCEAYQGRDFLIAIVVDAAKTDRNRYGLVMIAAPESAGGKYKPYWVLRDQDLSSCEIDAASGSLWFQCKQADGTEESKSLAWFRSRRQFELKDLDRYGVSGP